MLLLLPTDTCYGLAGAFCEKDYSEIYRQKKRQNTKQLALLVRDFDMLATYGEISKSQIHFLQQYPFPWSVILERKRTWQLPDFLEASVYTYISFRSASVCLSSETLHLLATASPKQTFPFFLTSANISKHKEAQTFSEAQEQFPNIFGYDGGTCHQPPSDIFSFACDGTIQYIRKNSGDLSVLK